MRKEVESSFAVLPLRIIEKRIDLDSVSDNASITFWVISYFFNSGRVILWRNYFLLMFDYKRFVHYSKNEEWLETKHTNISINSRLCYNIF